MTWSVKTTIVGMESKNSHRFISKLRARTVDNRPNVLHEKQSGNVYAAGVAPSP